MSETANIVDQLKRSYEGNAWHGPALKELLADVSAERAAGRPLNGAHTIWEIVRHIITWERVVDRRLKGERVDEPEEGDWLEVQDTSPDAWQTTLASLAKTHEGLVQQVAALQDARLRETAVGTEYSVYFMLHGVIQHNLYHGGQIALLKRV
jgi:uncharacterized damage-inducible protein DinB